MNNILVNVLKGQCEYINVNKGHYKYFSVIKVQSIVSF